MFFTEQKARCPESPNVLADAFCPRFGVAVLARCGNFGATPPGIKGVIGPFDTGVFAHFFAVDSTLNLIAI